MNVPFRVQRERVLTEHPQVIVAEINERLHRWDDYMGDHGHLNASGHASVAEEIIRSLQEHSPELGRGDSASVKSFGARA
jgi:hypothetical protein